MSEMRRKGEAAAERVWGVLAACVWQSVCMLLTAWALRVFGRKVMFDTPETVVLVVGLVLGNWLMGVIQGREEDE